MEVVTTIHQLTGYVVAVVVLVAAAVAFGRARDAREFTPGPYVAAVVLLDLQVLVGLTIYGMDQYWEHPSALLSYAHPALALIALAAAHIGLKRGRGQQMAVDAHRAAGRGLLIALVFVLGAVVASTLGVRGVA